MPFPWFTPAAYRALLALPVDVRGVVLAAALALQNEPRPRGYERVEGSDAWRGRVGDYRIIYLIDTKDDSVTVTDIGPRRDIYRRH